MSTQPQGVKVKPFNEIAKSFDPMMPEETYNQLKKHYFDTFMKPYIPKDYSEEATWAEFDKTTARPKLMGSSKAHLLQLEQAWTAGRVKMMEPIEKLLNDPAEKSNNPDAEEYARNAKKNLDHARSQMEATDKLLARDGHSTSIPRFTGEAAGVTVDFTLAAEALGPEAGALAEDLLGTSKAATVAARMFRGGTSFASYEAAVANKEDRGVAALKGFITGAALDGALSLPGQLLRGGVQAKNVNKIVQEALTPGKVVDPAVDDVISRNIERDVQVAKQEGRASFLRESRDVKGVTVHMVVPGGEGQPPKSVEFPFNEGKEHETFYQVNKVLKQGGEVEGIEYHPDKIGLVNRFLSLQNKAVEQKYEARVVTTEANSAHQVAADMQLEGIPAEPIDHNKVSIPSPPRIPSRDQVKEVLSKAGVVEPELSNRAAQVGQLWQYSQGKLNLPQKSADVMLESLRGVVKNEHLNNILPNTMKGPERSIKTLVEEKTPETLDALKELGGDSTQLEETREGKLAKLYSLTQDPQFNNNTYFHLQAEDMLADLGHDPETIDLHSLTQVKTIEELGGLLKSEEIGKSLEEDVLLRSRGIDSPGQFEEAVRKGEIEIPASENSVVKSTRSGPEVTERKISIRPSRIGIQVTTEEMERIHPGSSALMVPAESRKTYGQVLKTLGITGLGPGDSRPLILFTEASRNDAWHENLHVGLRLASGGDSNIQPLINSWREGVPDFVSTRAMNTNVETANKIGLRLNEHPAYNLDSNPSRGIWDNIEEAFVHSATAVRTGDVRKLAQLAVWDTSVRHVLDMVEDFGIKAVNLSKEQVDSAPIRNFQRAMDHAVMKASRNQYWEMQIEAQAHNASVHYDPFDEVWKYVREDGSVSSYKDSSGMINYMMRQNGEVFAPSISLPLEMRGVRGPIVPRGGAPSSKLPMPTFTPSKDQKWVGWKAISAAWRPMMPWVAGVHEKINEVFGTKGQYLPLYEKVTTLDRAYNEGMDWKINQYETAADFLKGNPKKLGDYQEVLMTEPKYWEGMKSKLHLDDKDMENITKADQWLKGFRDDTNVLVFNYLREQLPRLRGANYDLERVYGGRAKESSDMSFFHSAINDGALNPKDIHLGRFVNFLIREGFEKKYTAEPLSELKKIIDLKSEDGKYVLGTMRWPLENYVNYMKGIPDTTQQVMLRLAGDFQKTMGKQFARMNKYLPENAKLPTEFNYPGNFLNRMMTLSYVGSLGARPAIAIRDAMQMLTTSLPVLGTRFMEGMSGVTRAGFERAEAHGALLNKTNPGELYGDIFSEMPAGGNSLDKASRLANKLLAPSRWGHNVARSVAYNAEYESTLTAVQKYRTGAIDAHELLTQTSMWWYDKPQMNELLKMATDKSVPLEEVAKRSGLNLVDLTLWPYRRGTQPTMLRTGLGRVFGQYGMWPLNYADFLARGIRKYAEFPAQSARASAFWVASNYAAVSVMNSQGADVGKWFWTSPSGYGGSPHFELIQALAKSPENTDEGRKARKTVLEYPLDFIPASNEIKSVMKAIDDGGPPFLENGHPSPNFLRVMGFKPINEEKEQRLEDLSFEEKMKYQLGYKQVR